jgi:Endonuclease/Exonuclease/phosphatase family
MTKELQLEPKPDGFELQWSYYAETKLYIIKNDPGLYNEMKNHSFLSLYQREPFQRGSPTHQWIWHYNEHIPREVSVVHKEVIKEFRSRVTVQLLPQHYEAGVMENYIKHQIKKREKDYINPRLVSIMIVTWNVAATGPKESLVDLIKCNNESFIDPPDVIVIALQEICALNAKNLLGDENRKNEWSEFVISQANLAYPSQSYNVLIQQHLVGLFCIVLTSNYIHKYTGKARQDLVKVGMGGYAGNKGGICLRFEIFNSSFCIVNCHLAAHKGKVRLRNKNIKTILDEANFNIDGIFYKIMDHDFVFLTGDLNYRIKTLSYQSIQDLICGSDLNTLMQYDQLLIEKNTNELFSEFQEAPLSFYPTFKVLKGSNEYE